jgi:hypothetical protein
MVVIETINPYGESLEMAPSKPRGNLLVRQNCPSNRRRIRGLRRPVPTSRHDREEDPPPRIPMGGMPNITFPPTSRAVIWKPIKLGQD